MERGEPCSNGQSRVKKPPAKLSLIVGMDLHHVQLKLVEQLKDSHGFMAVYACSLSQKLITEGNRMYPYNKETARIALSNTSSFGVATDNTSDLEDDNLSSLPSTALFHSALQENCQTAVRLGLKSPALKFCQHSLFKDSQGNSYSNFSFNFYSNFSFNFYSTFSFNFHSNLSFNYNDGGNDSSSSVRFSGNFSSVRFSGNDGDYIDRIPAPG